MKPALQLKMLPTRQLSFIGHELWFFLEFPEVMRLAARQVGFYKKSQAEDSLSSERILDHFKPTHLCISLKSWSMVPLHLI